jgi:photosystem II stability/assembly factor-like uncharacterized protein
LLHENGLSDHRTDAARTPESGKSSEGMNEKDDELAHPSILARTANPRNCAANQQFASDTWGRGANWLRCVSASRRAANSHRGRDDLDPVLVYGRKAHLLRRTSTEQQHT